MHILGKRSIQNLGEHQIESSRKKRRKNITAQEWRVLNFLIEEQNLDRETITVMFCGVPITRDRLAKERKRSPQAYERYLHVASSVLPPEFELKLSLENLPWIEARELLAAHVLSCNASQVDVTSTLTSISPAEKIAALSLPSRASSLEGDFKIASSRTPIFDCILGAIFTVSNDFGDTRKYSAYQERNERTQRKVLFDLLTSSQAIHFLRILYRYNTPTMAAFFQILFRDALRHRNLLLIRSLAENGKIDLNRTVPGTWPVFENGNRDSTFELLQPMLPLEVAIRQSNTKMVKLLVDLGADLNVRSCFDDESLLTVAVEMYTQRPNSKKVDRTVRSLIKLGIQDQQHAISYFIVQEDFNTARALIEKCIDGNDGFLIPSPLSIAVQAEDEELVRLLLDKGVDPCQEDIVDDVYDPFSKITLLDSEDLLDHPCVSPLIAACEAGFVQVARMLLPHIPEKDMLNDWSKAFSRAASQGHLAILKMLLECTASFDMFFEMEAALQDSYLNENLEVAKLLIECEPGLLLQRSLFQTMEHNDRDVKTFILHCRDRFDDEMSRIQKLVLYGQASLEDAFQDALCNQRMIMWAFQSANVSDQECEALVMLLNDCGRDLGVSPGLRTDCNRFCKPRPTPLSTAIYSRPSIVPFLLFDVLSLDDPGALQAAIDTNNLELSCFLSKAIFQGTDRPQSFLKVFGGRLFTKCLSEDNLALSDVLFEAGARPSGFSTHERFIQKVKSNEANVLKNALDQEVYIHSKYFGTKIPSFCLAIALVKATPSIGKMQTLLDIGAPVNFFLRQDDRYQYRCCSSCSPITPTPLSVAFESDNEAAVAFLLSRGAHVNDDLIINAMQGYTNPRSTFSFVQPNYRIAKKLLAARRMTEREFIHKLAHESLFDLSEPECTAMLEWMHDRPQLSYGFIFTHQSRLNLQGFKLLQDSQRELRMIDLIASVESKDLDKAKGLLKAGLDIKQVFHGYNLPLFHAGRRFQRQWPEEVEIDGVRDRSPLQLAAQKGTMEMVQLLISYGADVNEPPAPEQGVTAMQAAAIGGYLQIAATLWGKGANVNAAGAQKYGITALEGAAEWGRIDMVQLLLLAGADIRKQSAFGKRQYENAIKYARDRGYHAVVDLIENHRQKKA